MRFHKINEVCKYPPLPVNQSGVKVMLAGFAKMGTRTMSRTLYELGYERSFHGEEFLMHVWHPIAHNYWARPENGGHVISHIGTLGTMFKGVDWDLQVLNNTRPEEIARMTSSCRTDAVALDGAEALFWPIMEVSPTAKVIVLNWRTYEDAKMAMTKFTNYFGPWLIMNGNLDLGIHVLPWALLFNVFEPIFGHPMTKYLNEGWPPLNQVQSPYFMVWQRHMANVRYVGHWMMGLSVWQNDTKEEHEAFFERIKTDVPPERRLEVDPRRTTYEELCEFLELSPCRKSGRMPRAINLGNHEIDFFPAFVMCVPIWLFVHWVNWRVLHWIFLQVGLLLLLLRSRVKCAMAK